jgi:hypothetical protein
MTKTSSISSTARTNTIKFNPLVYLQAELNSQGPITESASIRINRNNKNKQKEKQIIKELNSLTLF